MTESDALAFLDATVPRETMLKLHRLVHLVLLENRCQNLIAKSTEPAIWNRHILDSAQLWRFGTDRERIWLDVGTGAGFPGVVLALLSQSNHILIEPRKRRVAFLELAVAELGLRDRVRVLQSTVEKVQISSVGTITARAVSSIEQLLATTCHLADRSTTWALNKGRQAATEISRADAVWDASFERSTSVTDPEASIVRVSRMVGRRGS